jgi:IS605 OrfB family transposase
MQKVEQHIIKSNHKDFKEIDNLAFFSKNLYNAGMYHVRQSFFKGVYENESSLYKHIKATPDYLMLPSKVAVSISNIIIQNWKSYYSATKAYKKNPTNFTGKPKLPHYKNKDSGRFLLQYTNQAISKKVFTKTGKIHLSKTNIDISTGITKFSSINQVRIIPKYNYYVIEVIYTILDVELKTCNERYLSLDLGVNNLAAITSNIIDPQLINGKSLKSINHYYNKKKAYLQSKLKYKVDANNKFILDKKGDKVQIQNSNKLAKLTLKRKNKIDNYLHKASKYVVKLASDNNINTIVIGHNKLQKQTINIGKKNNQNFVQIPLSRFIQMNQYKCEEKGINVVIQEESYTSKASCLSQDKIPIYNKNSNNAITFSGKRISRGLYKDFTTGKIISSDVNGSANILRKAFPKAFANGIQGILVCPKVAVL